MVGVVEPVHGPKQIPSLPSVANATLMLLIKLTPLIRIAVICIAAPPGGPVVLRHLAFAVYVAAVYIRNRGAAASVCPAGWTWVEELCVRRRSAAVVDLSGLSRVRAGRRGHIVEAVGGGLGR